MKIWRLDGLKLGFSTLMIKLVYSNIVSEIRRDLPCSKCTCKTNDSEQGEHKHRLFDRRFFSIKQF